jgi:hypothetical protein
MNIPLLGIGSLLHSFTNDHQERRQYPRVRLRFALWWLKDLRGSKPIPGLGIEISGGGVQFLLQHKIGSQCSLAFQVNDRPMRASVDVLQSAETVFEEQPWQHYRAKFVGLMEADYKFISALADALPSDGEGLALRSAELSVGSHQSYDMLPSRIREQIVARLVAMKRLTPPQDLGVAHLAAHYAGIKGTNDGSVVHRFFVRSHMNSTAGAFVFNTELLISDDGTEVCVGA